MDGDILSMVAGILAVAAVALLIVWMQKRRAREAWAATVTRIDQYDGGGAAYVRVRFERDDGRTASFELPARDFAASFPGLKTGDRLVKPSGGLIPRKG